MMKEPKYYQTIKTKTEGLFKDRGSKFYGYAFPVKSEEEVHEKLAQLRKQHIKSRHCCYAYQIGTQGTQFRINDDGEPSGTAGKPIYGCLQKYDLTDTLIAVIRYFGGTKLGVPGLINAYRAASLDALDKIEIDRYLIGDEFIITTDYSLSSTIIDDGKKLEMELVGQNFSEHVETIFNIPRGSQKERILALLKKLTHLDFDTVEEYGGRVKVEQK